MTAQELIRELQQHALGSPVVWETRYDDHTSLTHIGGVTEENGRIVLRHSGSIRVESPAVAQPWLRTKA